MLECSSGATLLYFVARVTNARAGDGDSGLKNNSTDANEFQYFKNNGCAFNRIPSLAITNYLLDRKASSRFLRASKSPSEDPCFDWDGTDAEERLASGRRSSGSFELVAWAVLALLGSAGNGGSSSRLGIDSCERKPPN